MVETEVTYLGPLHAINHKGPSGIFRYFFRDRPMKYDFSLEDLQHYASSGGFKVKKVVIKKKMVPVQKEELEEVTIGG